MNKNDLTTGRTGHNPANLHQVPKSLWTRPDAPSHGRIRFYQDDDIESGRRCG